MSTSTVSADPTSESSEQTAPALAIGSVLAALG
jgi:hypothetical protein